MKRFAMMLALSGCAGFPGAPVPQAARLSADMLVVTLSDASVCRVQWQAAGRLDGCGPGFDYTVTVDQNPNILRQWVQELALALDAKGAVPPLAEVVISDASGRDWRFASPPPAPQD